MSPSSWSWSWPSASVSLSAVSVVAVVVDVDVDIGDGASGQCRCHCRPGGRCLCWSRHPSDGDIVVVVIVVCRAGHDFAVVDVLVEVIGMVSFRQSIQIIS